MTIIRKTKHLKQLLQIFDESKEAISAVKLNETLQEHMNRSTVYRALDRLEEEGIIHSFLGSDGHRWYAKCHNCCTNNQHDFHPHFQCNICGKVDCLEVKIDIPEIPKREVKSTHLLVFGTCEECL
ncbi:transcriptional repressor [bacterium]|nr:transcriptional repressor [bacterium]